MAIVGQSGKALAQLMAAGQAPPSPLWRTAVVDTGTNVTSITPTVLQQLGLLPTGQATSHTVSGQLSRSAELL
jgi:hypothetical protein